MSLLHLYEGFGVILVVTVRGDSVSGRPPIVHPWSYQTESVCTYRRRLSITPCLVASSQNESIARTTMDVYINRCFETTPLSASTQFEYTNQRQRIRLQQFVLSFPFPRNQQSKNFAFRWYINRMSIWCFHASSVQCDLICVCQVQSIDASFATHRTAASYRLLV